MREGYGLENYATWAAIAEVHGPDSTQWPAELRHPDLPGVRSFRRDHADAVEFHRWLQWVLDEQLDRDPAGAAPGRHGHWA